LQSEGYDAISGAKATGNLNEAEDEAEASTANIAKLNMKSVKCLHCEKVVLWQRNRLISLLEYYFGHLCYKIMLDLEKSCKFSFLGL